MKSSWWKLTIEDYPNYKPSDIDLEHIAEMIKQGYDNGQLIQDDEESEEDLQDALDYKINKWGLNESK